MSVEENKTLVREFLEQVWNEGNLAVIENTLAADYVNHDTSAGTFPPGPASYRQVATRFRDAFPDLHTTIEQVVDTVVGRVLDHLGVAHSLVPRWQEEGES